MLLIEYWLTFFLRTVSVSISISPSSSLLQCWRMPTF